MQMTNFYKEMEDFYFENEDLSRLYEMKDSDIYKEIVLFLDDFKPEWRKNKELGHSAPEFIHSIIDEYEEKYDSDDIFGIEDDGFEDEEEPKLTFKEWLHEMYEEIADRYDTYGSSYEIPIEEVDQILEDQGITFENDDNYMIKWNIEHEKLHIKKGEEIYLFF